MGRKEIKLNASNKTTRGSELEEFPAALWNKASLEAQGGFAEANYEKNLRAQKLWHRTLHCC